VIKHDLLEQLGREMYKLVVEKENGYPKTRRKIEQFIENCPVELREKFRKVLLP